MHFYTGEVQNTVLPKDQFKGSFFFFIHIIDCSKSILGKYKQLLLANDTD